MKDDIKAIFEESARVRDSFLAGGVETLIDITLLLVDVIRRGDKVMLFGNGGSAADAQHIAAEFVNRYRIERRPLPALALTTDTSILTAIGNDYDFSDIFAKQIMALGRAGDAVSVARPKPLASRAPSRHQCTECRSYNLIAQT